MLSGTAKKIAGRKHNKQNELVLFLSCNLVALFCFAFFSSCLFERERDWQRLFEEENFLLENAKQSKNVI